MRSLLIISCGQALYWKAYSDYEGTKMQTGKINFPETFDSKESNWFQGRYFIY